MSDIKSGSVLKVRPHYCTSQANTSTLKCNTILLLSWGRAFVAVERFLVIIKYAYTLYIIQLQGGLLFAHILFLTTLVNSANGMSSACGLGDLLLKRICGLQLSD